MARRGHSGGGRDGTSAAVPSDLRRWIVWQDEHLVAVDKPAGVASQGGDGLAGINLVDLARRTFHQPHVAVLHRIDRNVSGLVLLAKTTDGARAMSQLIAAGEMERRYDAVVRGVLDDTRVLTHWLRKDERSNQVTLREAPAAADPAQAPAGYKLAITRVTPVEPVPTLLGRCTQVQAWPITGRSHQIRAQLAASGLPIVGDPKYGVRAKGLQRPLLHARAVHFRHPLTGADVAIETRPAWDPHALTGLRRPTR